MPKRSRGTAGPEKKMGGPAPTEIPVLCPAQQFQVRGSGLTQKLGLHKTVQPATLAINARPATGAGAEPAADWVSASRAAKSGAKWSTIPHRNPQGRRTGNLEVAPTAVIKLEHDASGEREQEGIGRRGKGASRQEGEKWWTGVGGGKLDREPGAPVLLNSPRTGSRTVVAKLVRPVGRQN